MSIEARIAPAGIRAAVRGPWIAALWITCLVYPWVNPLASGPSASVQPWLVAAACAAALLALRGFNLPSFPVALWVAGACLLTALRGSSLDVWALGGALLVILTTAGAAAAADERDDFVRVVAAAWLVAALVSAGIGLAQYFGVSDRLAPWVSYSSVGEAYGNLRQRNQLASLVCIGLASLFYFVRQEGRPALALAPALLLAVGNGASASRTGAVEWVLVSLLAIAFSGPRRRAIITLAVSGLVAYGAAAVVLPSLLAWVTGVAGPSVFGRFIADAGCASRAVLWSNVLDLIAARPLVGWGWGEMDFAHYTTLYPGVRFCDILDNAHSLPLHLAAELGVPAAALACGALAWALWRLRPWRDGGAERHMALSVLAVLLLHSLLEYPLWYGPFQIAFGLCLGLLWPARTQPPGGAVARSGWRSGVAALLGMAAVGYAAWDYHRISQVYLPPEARAPAYQIDPLNEVRGSWLFRKQVRFAELTLTPLTRANAQWTYDAAAELLHYSPEPRVIEKMIESAMLLGREQEAFDHLRRFRAAFPAEHAAWAANLPTPSARPPTQ